MVQTQRICRYLLHRCLHVVYKEKEAIVQRELISILNYRRRREKQEGRVKEREPLVDLVIEGNQIPNT
jgi:hypothetical protein